MSNLFIENKRKKVTLPEDHNQDNKSTKKRDEKLEEKKGSWAQAGNLGAVPVWSDENVDRLKVRIEDTSRLRKLKKSE